VAVYTDKLPSIELAGDELKEFEEVVERDSTNPSLVFSFEKGGFQYSCGSVGDFIEDPDLPDIAPNFKFRMECDEGDITVDGRQNIGRGRIRISGEKEWVRKKERQLASQVKKNRRFFRTYLSWGVAGVYALSFLALFVGMVSSAPDSSSIEISNIEATVFIIIFLIFVTSPYFLIGISGEVVPYYLIKKHKALRHRPKLWKLARWTLIILTITGSIAGIASML